MMRHLYMLMLIIMVTVMSELQVAGMMPVMAADLGVGTGSIGLLVSIYAFGMTVGGTTFAFLLRRQPPKAALLAIIACYSVAQVLVPLIDALWWIASVRFITGALAGASFGLSLSYAARVAPRPERIGQAVSIVLGGITIGTVLGLPLSHLIAESWGWRASFFVLGGVTFLLLLSAGRTLPKRDGATATAAGQDLDNLRLPALWMRYLVSLLTIGAAYASFSFFTPLLEVSSGFSSAATTGILLAYGLCAYIGNAAVGRLADTRAVEVLRSGLAALVVALAVLATCATNQPLALAMVLVVGLVGVSMNPALVTRVAEIGGMGTMVSTVHTAVISAGVALGSAMSGIAMSWAGDDDPTIAMWTGSGLGLVAVIAALATGRGRTGNVRSARGSDGARARAAEDSLPRG